MASQASRRYTVQASEGGGFCVVDRTTGAPVLVKQLLIENMPEETCTKLASLMNCKDFLECNRASFVFGSTQRH